MKFKEFKDFRNCSLKLVEISNIPQKIKKGLKIENLEEPLIGILYIDYECGISLRILGNADQTIEDEMLIARAETFDNMIFKIISNSKYNKELEKIKENYYKDEKINELREIKELDKFRNQEFPDDVVAILPIENIGNEQMWCRLFLKTNKENLYVGRLLNSSDYNKNYQVGSYVGITDYKRDGTHILLINGLVQFKEE